MHELNTVIILEYSQLKRNNLYEFSLDKGYTKI